MLPIGLEFISFISLAYVIFVILPQKFRKSFLVFISLLYFASFPIIHIIYLLFIFLVVFPLYKFVLPKGRIFLCNFTITTSFLLIIINNKYNFFSPLDLIELKTKDKQIEYFTTLYPIGISFHFLQILSIFNDRNLKTLSSKDFFLNIFFIPKVLSGPIEKISEFNKQFSTLTPGPYFAACELFIIGFALKVLIANPMGPYLRQIFDEFLTYDQNSLALGLVLFRIQLYADFFGYFLIACGVAKLFNISLTQNFSRPYCSVGLSDHWRRWNITLGAWFRDHTLFPLAGYAKTPLHMGILVIIVFSLVGLWHGFEFKYLIWGTCNGIVIALESIYLREKIHNINVSKIFIFRMFFALVTFFIISLFSVFIRSPNVEQSFLYLGALFSGDGSTSLEILTIQPFVLFILMEIFHWITELRAKKIQVNTSIRFLFIAILLLLIYRTNGLGYQGFLYFQF